MGDRKANNANNANSNSSKGKWGKMQWAILLRTMVPMLIMGMIIAGSAIKFNEAAIKNEVSDSLAMSAISIREAYNQMYPGDYEIKGNNLIALYKGDTDITADYKYIDSIKKSTGVEVSIIHGNTRILTTLVDSQGVRQISTGVNPAIVNEVDSYNSHFSYEGLIGTEKYYAYYAPLVNSDGTVVGMIGVAKQYNEIVTSARKAVIPVCIITFICMIIAGIICTRYTNDLVDCIRKIEKFLQNMIKGELSNEMPSSVLERKDELGTTAKNILDMQSAIRVLVERDPLTTLYNRRYGGARLRKLQRDSEKSGMPYSLCLGDIDFFKRVNDTYGHEVGDMVLKKVSETLKKSMVGKGFVSRWGGEEFLVVFSKCDANDAKREMEIILDKIRSLEILYDSHIIKITMTFGIVDGSMSKDFAELLRESDSRLYYGKMNGRNRIVLNEEALDKTNKGDASLGENAQNTSGDDRYNASEEINKREQSESGEIKETKNSKDQSVPGVKKTASEDIIIDDAFLQQIIDKMSDKLLKETTQD